MATLETDSEIDQIKNPTRDPFPCPCCPEPDLTLSLTRRLNCMLPPKIFGDDKNGAPKLSLPISFIWLALPFSNLLGAFMLIKGDYNSNYWIA